MKASDSMADDDPDVSALSKKEAQSRNVSYSDAQILHETSKTRIAVVPFYIHRSHGDEVAIKIQTFTKQPYPNDHILVDEKSVSLNDAATRKLQQVLGKHLAIAGKDEGDYIVIRVSEGTAQLGEHDPALIASALTKVLSQEAIVQHLSSLELSEELTRALKGVIRLAEMQSAVTQLRNHLDTGEDDEQVYQKWCKEHSWAFGNAYVMRDDVREISPGDSLDMLLPTVISGYRDIVELKRPSMSVLRYDDAHRNYYFSHEVSKAIGQVHRYLDVLHEVAAKGLRDHPEIVAYHPRAIVVIGRSNSSKEDELRALHGLNHRLSSITVMTYDQLLAQGERLIAAFSIPLPDDSPTTEPDPTELDDMDIPF